MKKNNTRAAKLFAALFFLLCLMISPLRADGKLLRGEKWQKFHVPTTADFYVAPNGDDAWSGTLAEANESATDGPFATLQRAQQAVRELKKRVYKPKGEPIEKNWIGSPHPFGVGRDILVLIRGGEYSLSQPLLFTPRDGGERIETNLPSGAFEYHKLRDNYVAYAAYPGETPVFMGGPTIHGWRKDGRLWKAKVATEKVDMLVADGEKQVLARAPNEGYFTPPAISESKRELHFRPGELRQWPDMDGNRVIMLLRWHTGVNSFERIDEGKGVAWFKKEQPGIVVVPPRYYVENVMALLDAPGEWYFDAKGGELSWMPRNGDDPNEARIVAPAVSQLIVVRGDHDKPVRNLRFYGLHFEAVNSGGKAISFEYTNGCELVDAELHAFGGAGVTIGKGCYKTRILDNQFTQIDGGVIQVDGDAHPQNWADVIQQTIISRNRIDDCGGVNIEAHNTLYTTISRNEITNTRGRYAISVGGWANLEEAIDGGYRVEYNHLHDVQKDADDSGVIKTAGMTYDSIVRRNLIHDVKAGYFNDNVGFWFDNMSLGWLTEENIYYNLEQAEMKLCAANLVDNIYQNNFIIEPPAVEPEGIIEGEPEFGYSDLVVKAAHTLASGDIESGTFLRVSADIRNVGASGILPVRLFLDGEIAQTKLFPVIRNNSRRIEFGLHLYEAGVHELGIGASTFQSVAIVGRAAAVVFESIQLSDTLAPAGDSIGVFIETINRTDKEQSVDVNLRLDDAVVQNKKAIIAARDTVVLSFRILPAAGRHTVRVDNSLPAAFTVFSHAPLAIDLSKAETYCSGRAQPCDIQVEKNKVVIKAGGTDFYHAEDSYAAIYLPKIKGNFVATVKVTGFGRRTHEWFRAGLFVRNDMAKSFDVGPGSLGSVLMFTTPGRAGIQWDEFGDGCMHKAASANLPENVQYPVWLKLVRRGDSFSGYISFDGATWVRERRTRPVPGLADAVDIGLAAGAGDEEQYRVQFEDFQLSVEGGRQ